MYTTLPHDKINARLPKLIKWWFDREGKTNICTSESKGFFFATDYKSYKSWTCGALGIALSFLLDNIYDISSKSTLTADNGKKMNALTVFSESIRFFVGNFNNRLDTIFNEVNSNEIRWVLTVPAIWNEKAKSFMREAAIKVLNKVRIKRS
ncbi:hypothetical protein FSP39_013736 [Pinctada imbricata]|uniref:Uncharacterized protein n=1 Tax=Pinctada imbricata TaxID=66713 RepID=A0AA88XFJ1_PINIB|nr:hypothetical protein FSP39_013736 [Pinctada imbricata]